AHDCGNNVERIQEILREGCDPGAALPGGESDEPDEQIAASMLRAMVPLMENHFGVCVRDEAVTEAVRLSHRYITGRQLPDKAVSVLDTACARVALGQTSAPALL